MSGDLLRIKMRVNKLKADCVTPSSDFYRSPESRELEIARIDAVIGRIKNERMNNISGVLALEELWKNFKGRLLLFIETDKRVRSAEGESEDKTIDLFFDELESSSSAADPIRQSLPSVKAIWNTFKTTRTNAGLKDFVAAMAEPLQSEIESMINAERVRANEERANAPPPAPVAQRVLTPEELAIQASQISLEQERAARAAEKRQLLFRDKPNISKLIQLLALRLAAGEYGDRIREAFLESHPSVISSSSLLKFLLLEASNHTLVPHTLNQWEIDISDENWAAILRAKDQIQNVSAETIEEIFLGEGSFSEGAQQLLSSLNEAVKDLPISREDEQIYGQFLRDVLDASCSYQAALSHLGSLRDPDERIKLLKSVIVRFESLDPQSFFAATDRILQGLSEARASQEAVEAWVNYLDAELKKNPHIMTSFREGEYLVPHLERSEGEHILEAQDARFSILLVPGLLRSNPSKAFELIEEVLEYATGQPSFTLPIELFQMVMNLRPLLALQIAENVPLRDRFQCFIQLMHVEGRSNYSALDLDKLVDRTIEGAKEFFEGLMLKYLDERTPQNTSKLKVEIRRLLKYLTAEVGSRLPQEVKDLHPYGSIEAQIECALLEEYLELSLETSEEEWDDREKIQILFFPELVRIGKREEAIRYADADLNWFTDTENPNRNPPIKELARSLLKASGFKSPLLDNHTLGPLSEPDNPHTIALDVSFINRYFEAMKAVKDVKWKVLELIAFSKASYEIGMRFDNESYTAFSIQAAEAAQEAIKGINVRRGRVESRISNCITALELIDHWIGSLGFANAQASQDIKREFQLKLFNLRKEYLATRTSPVDKVCCCIELFLLSVLVGKEDEGLRFARQALSLNPAPFLDDRTGIMRDPFMDLLEIAYRNVGVLSSKEGEEARRLQSETETFILDLIQSSPDFDRRINFLIQAPGRLIPQNAQFSSEAARRAFQEIQTFRGIVGADPLAHKIRQTEALIQLIQGFQSVSSEIIALAKRLLQEVLDELLPFEQNYTDPIERFKFHYLLIEGFKLLENSARVLTLVSKALPLVTSENLRSLNAPLAHMVNGLITYIKLIHGENRLEGPNAIESALIDMVLLGLFFSSVRSERIRFLISVPRVLLMEGYLEDSSLYKEFSKRALNRILNEIKGMEIPQEGSIEDQEGLFQTLIQKAEAIDPALAAQFRQELIQIQESRRPNLKRGRDGDEGGNPPNKRPNIDEH